MNIFNRCQASSSAHSRVCLSLAAALARARRSLNFDEAPLRRLGPILNFIISYFVQQRTRTHTPHAIERRRLCEGCEENQPPAMRAQFKMQHCLMSSRRGWNENGTPIARGNTMMTPTVLVCVADFLDGGTPEQVGRRAAQGLNLFLCQPH